jgi:hypothetical protein
VFDVVFCVGAGAALAVLVVVIVAFGAGAVVLGAGAGADFTTGVVVDKTGAAFTFTFSSIITILTDSVKFFVILCNSCVILSSIYDI